MKNYILLTSVLLLLSGCKDANSEYEATPVAQSGEITTLQHPGKKLLENNCYVCHSPTAGMADLIAPPMAAVKAHYLMNDPSKDEFVNSIVSFVKDPSEQKSQMPGAIGKFGLMPKQKFPDGAVEKIAEYMFEYQIEEPEWFAEHWKAGMGSGMYRQQGRRMGPGMGTQLRQGQREQYEKKGIEIAMAAQKLLGQNLMREVQDNGTLEALEFCNVQAIPLTDSVAKKYNATVQRVTDRNRNPENEANSEEKALIEVFQREMAAGKDPRPIVHPKADSVRFYYPLMTNSLCLECHGKKEDIEPAVHERIMKLYPQDKAIGYSENEVRGIWKIGFKK